MKERLRERMRYSCIREHSGKGIDGPGSGNKIIEEPSQETGAEEELEQAPVGLGGARVDVTQVDKCHRQWQGLVSEIADVANDHGAMEYACEGEARLESETGVEGIEV